MNSESATLLVSLGKSPAIVPEAFLFPGASFDQVHVLTTASIEESGVAWVEDWFAAEAPQVTLTITRVQDFSDFKSEEDHFVFEEVLFRWMLQRAETKSCWVCLTGGFKTMSAAVQKAAAIFGAAGVFHVLCDLPFADQPRTASQIRTALDNGHLHWIKLGPESGWPQFRNLHSLDYPLIIRRQEGRVSEVASSDQALRRRVSEVVERSHRIAGAWDRLGQLPFPLLATWSAADLDWLDQPVDPVEDAAWVAGLPKLELHCHLGGFATRVEALHQVRAAASDPSMLPVVKGLTPPGEWPLPGSTITLQDYMTLGDDNGSALLRDPGCLAAQCDLLYYHLRSQNVIYAEIRCSPANYASTGRSPWSVLVEIQQSFDRRMQDDGPDVRCHINLIIIATRKKEGDYRAAISRHLALAVSAAEHWTDPSHCQVVGVDLAGYEDVSTRAHYFREEFTAIHRCGLALTVHAGENDEAEGIWRAVFDLNARRLGHALHLIDSPELMRSVADRGIGVEMCPYANYQIKGFPLPGTGGLVDYPLKRYLDAGIRVTVNTDNIGISAANLSDNLLLAARLCPQLTRMDVLRIQSHAIQAAFISPTQRARLAGEFSSRLHPQKSPQGFTSDSSAPATAK